MRPAEQEAVPTARKAALAAVLAEIRNMLATLGAAELIREDACAVELFADLGRTEGMEAFSAALDRLGDRVDELIIARTGAAPGVRASLHRIAPRHAAETALDDSSAAVPARTFLRL
jgi:enamine deaminase RidA (YjgF/YER057c/UK114 family)